ncbi:MAG: hypothetical protein IPJ71_19195 [Bdellovibrionales bacterium]|nr:hypothetical protein [Bdellovibrionales bacterium]
MEYSGRAERIEVRVWDQRWNALPLLQNPVFSETQNCNYIHTQQQPYGEREDEKWRVPNPPSGDQLNWGNQAAHDREHPHVARGGDLIYRKDQEINIIS